MKNRTVQVGDILYGYCEGYFNGEYADKVVVGVGRDWVVARIFGEDRYCFQSDPDFAEYAVKFLKRPDYED